MPIGPIRPIGRMAEMGRMGPMGLIRVVTKFRIAEHILLCEILDCARSVLVLESAPDSNFHRREHRFSVTAERRSARG